MYLKFYHTAGENARVFFSYAEKQRFDGFVDKNPPLGYHKSDTENQRFGSMGAKRRRHSSGGSP